MAGTLPTALETWVTATMRVRSPMLPLDIFKSRQVTYANVLTFSVYAALGILFFLLVVYLQEALGYARPVYGHLPIILNTDGSKMGKRDRDKKIRQSAQVWMISRASSPATHSVQ